MLLQRNDANAWTKTGLFLPALHPGNLRNCVQENSVMQYTLLTLHAVQFAQHMLVLLPQISAFHTAYACYE